MKNRKILAVILFIATLLASFCYMNPQVFRGSVFPLAFHFETFGVFFLIAVAVALFCFVTPTTIKRLPAYFAVFKQYLYLLSNLIARDFTVKYRRSALGILWSVLNPLLMMLVLTTVFQHMFRLQVENYPIYYLSGAFIFSFISDSTSSAMISVINSASLIKKVYIPKYIFPVEKCLFSLLNSLLSLVALILIMAITRFVPPPTIALFFIPVFYALLFSLGLSLLLSSLNVFFRDIGHLYGVWITAWMYLTPIIYPISIIPESLQGIFKLNPLYHYVDYFRQLALYGTIPGLAENVLCLSIGVIMLCFGVFFFKKTQDKFILYI